jgi:hypothetical protein
MAANKGNAEYPVNDCGLPFNKNLILENEGASAGENHHAEHHHRSFTQGLVLVILESDLYAHTRHQNRCGKVYIAGREIHGNEKCYWDKFNELAHGHPVTANRPPS